MATRFREIPGQSLAAVGRPVDRAVPVDGLATLGHDLKSPLTAMKCCLGLVLSEEAGALNPDQRRFLQRALNQAVAMERMVSDELDLAGLPPGEVRVRPRDLDLAEVVREAAEVALAAARLPGRTVDLDKPGESWEAHADPDLVTRILGNVLGNALKFTPASCGIRVGWRCDAGPSWFAARALAERCGANLNEGLLVIRDDGPGLPAEFVDQAFEPFRRGPSGPDGPTEGSGLGLAIGRKLARAQGGELNLASIEGRGTTVRLRLPRDRQTSRFLVAARRLQNILDGMAASRPEASIGLIDCRDREPALPVVIAQVRRFLRDVRSLAGGACEIMPGIVACAVADPRAFSRRWKLAAASSAGGDRQGGLAVPGRKFINSGRIGPMA